MILDRLDTEILHMLKEDPRNVSAIARKLRIPVETVRYRLKRMLDNGFIRPFAIPNFPRLGLTALMAFLESKFWRDLEDLLDSHPYVTYISRCYGQVNGYLVNMLSPREEESSVYGFFRELEGVSDNIKRVMITPILPLRYPLPRFDKYYDYRNGRWRFTWNPLLKVSPSRAPSNLTPSKAHLDHVDIVVVKKLQSNAMVSLSELAEALGVSVTCVRYHFLNHIMRGGLVDYAVRYLPYPGTPLSVFVIELTREEYVGGLIKAAEGLPPIVALTNSLRENLAILFLQAPMSIKLGFYEALKRLMDGGIVSSYFEAILDPRYVRKYTIPEPEYYEDGKWISDVAVPKLKTLKARG